MTFGYSMINTFRTTHSIVKNFENKNRKAQASGPLGTALPLLDSQENTFAIISR